MEERILGLAAEITGEEPTELLKTLCLSAEAEPPPPGGC